MEKQTYKYGIIGAGPAGFTAALEAAKNGHSVVLFEKDYLGGVCLNKGCIPTKTILHSVNLFDMAKNSEDIGICAENLKLDISKVMERKNKVIETLRRGLEHSLKRNNVTIVPFEANVIGDNIIKSNGELFTCDNIIVATGSEPKPLKGFDFDHEFILNSDDVLELKEFPKNILIVGAGVEGIEWSNIFSAAESNVTMIDVADRVLNIADEEISQRTERILKKKKIKLVLNTKIESIENRKVTLSNGEVLEPDAVFVAIGRNIKRPQVEGKVIYLGDTSGSMMTANFAMYQAKALLSGIKFDTNVFMPSVVFSTPEIAWVGAREQDLPLNSYQKKVFPISALGKAHCDNDTEGFIKVLSYDGEIIGAHIISKEASALIHQFVLAMQNNVSVDDLKKVCFAHPTYSEGVYESILGL